MDNSRCFTCLFGNRCKNQYRCDAYAPLDNESYDEYFDEYIEEQRAEFLEEWWIYTSDLFE